MTPEEWEVHSRTCQPLLLSDTCHKKGRDRVVVETAQHLGFVVKTIAPFGGIIPIITATTTTFPPSSPHNDNNTTTGSTPPCSPITQLETHQATTTTTTTEGEGHPVLYMIPFYDVTEGLYDMHSVGEDDQVTETLTLALVLTAT